MSRILLCAGTLLLAVVINGINGIPQEGSYSASIYPRTLPDFAKIGYQKPISSNEIRFPFPSSRDIESNLLVTGYPKNTPSKEFTYPSTSATVTFKPLITGYPKVTPSREFSYPTTSRTTPNPLITGYPKITPIKEFTYPSTSSTTPKPLITGYPKVTPSKQFTYPSPSPSTTYKPLITGYPKVTPSREFTFPTTSITTSKPLITGYPTVTPSKQFTYPSPSTSTTSKPVITGYTKITPIREFTYPTTSTTTPKPLITGYNKVTPGKPFTYPSPTTSTTSKPLITGYPKVTPSRGFTYPTTSTTTPKPLITGYTVVTPSKPFTYPSPSRSTTSRPLTTGYPKVTPSREFTYPTTSTTTSKPLITGYPKVTPSKLFTYPSPSISTTSGPLVTGYPKVTPNREFTYPTTSTTTFRPAVTGYSKVTPYPSQLPSTTTKPPVTGYPKVTPTRKFTYPTPPTTASKPHFTGYPKVTTSKPFTFPSTSPRTTFKPLITGYPKVTPSRVFTYPSPTTTTPKSLITGYPKVTPSKPFIYPSPLPSTTSKPLITGYPKVTPSRQFTYPTTSTTTPKPLITGYPKITPSKEFTYPTYPTGYPKVTPDREFTYPPTSTTTPKSIVTGYPRVAPEKEFIYPSRAPIISTRSAVSYRKASLNDEVAYPTSLHSSQSSVNNFKEDSGVIFVNIPGASIPSQSTHSRYSALDPATYNPDKNAALINYPSFPSSLARPRIARSLPPTKDKREPRLSHADEDDDDEEEEGDEEKHRKWNIRTSVPGEPGKDYPILSSIPVTSFSCAGRIEGYFADQETGCQVFHLCSEGAGNVKSSFLCPNGSIFNERLFTCDWWRNVECIPTEIQNPAALLRDPSLAAQIHARNYRRGLSNLQEHPSLKQRGGQQKPNVNSAVPIHSGLRLSSKLFDNFPNNFAGRVHGNNSPWTAHLRSREYNKNGEFHSLNPSEYTVLAGVNDSRPVDEQGKTEIEIIKSVQINDPTVEMLDVKAESNDTDLNLSINQSELGKGSDLITHMIISKSALGDELDRTIPKMSQSASILAASVNDNFSFKVNSPVLFSGEDLSLKTEASNVETSGYPSEENSFPQLIPSLSFDFRSLEDKRGFARVVAAGVLGHKPTQSQLDEFLAQYDKEDIKTENSTSISVQDSSSE